MFTYINKIYSFTDSGVNYFLKLFEFFSSISLSDNNNTPIFLSSDLFISFVDSFSTTLITQIIILSAFVSRIFFHAFAQAFSDW